MILKTSRFYRDVFCANTSLNSIVYHRSDANDMCMEGITCRVASLDAERC